jgi:TolA-binding protein
VKNNYLLFIFLLPILSCASLLGVEMNGDNGDSVTANEKMAPALERESENVTVAELRGLELKQAQLWSRVDELEDFIRRQKARIKVLEKGLLLGVVPEELGSHASGDAQDLSKMDVSSDIDNPPSTKKMNVTQSDPSAKSDQDFDKESYLKKMSSARDLFRSGRYGKAYLAFSRIDKNFTSSDTSGEQKYWLGRCWYKLKEFQSARQYLQSYIGSYPNSPWTVSAKFYLAKAELDLGMKEAAVRRFQQIIRDNPYAGTAEAAKQVLGNMQKTF